MQMPEWWDWDLPGGGVDGRWADPEPEPVPVRSPSRAARIDCLPMEWP